MSMQENQRLVADSFPFARSYQLEALEKALKGNTIVFLETGSGKTLIAIMLLRNYAHSLRKPSSYAVFLAPTVVLVNQQSEVIAKHTDLKVGKYYGDMHTDSLDAAKWKQETDEHQVLVMTPMILFKALSHGYLSLREIKVIMFDECHHAIGDHAYALIMKLLYHPQLKENGPDLLPRIFGMTASPIKTKGASTKAHYWEMIRKLENLMNSKIFTCESESVLAQYIPFSTTKVKLYEDVDVPCANIQCIANNLKSLAKEYEDQLKNSCSDSRVKSARKLSKIFNNFEFCLTKLGPSLAIKAAETLSCETNGVVSSFILDITGEKVVKDFSSYALKVFKDFTSSGVQESDERGINKLNLGKVTPKVHCLVDTLLEDREIKDLRCIVFVERIITAIVIRDLLNEKLHPESGWRTEYTAGNSSDLQSQSRIEQNKIVEEFRNGTVNIIIATSMLEEGLDVQKCNLVIRFDPSANVCSFIQSRGRARMQNSDFISMVKRGDAATLNRVKNFLASGDIMRKECLGHAAIPCEHIDTNLNSEEYYEVEFTGAKVFLSSSVSLLHLYCTRLPSDRYFKPCPRFEVDKESRTCVLHLPKSCPIQTITVQGNMKIVKRLACLEACKKLHQVGALTDHLVPNIVEGKKEVEESGYKPGDVAEHVQYYPPELIGNHDNQSVQEVQYYCYLIHLEQKFNYNVQPQDIVLAIRMKLESDIEKSTFGLDVEKGKLIVNVKCIGTIKLTFELVRLCQQFQTTVLKHLFDNNFCHLSEDHGNSDTVMDCKTSDYLLLPTKSSPTRALIDWECIKSVLFRNKNKCDMHIGDSHDCHGHLVHTKNGPVCTCMLENSLVSTPHKGFVYCINGTLGGLHGTSTLRLGDEESVTYKEYYAKKHGITLHYENEVLLSGRRIFRVQNCLRRSNRNETAREQGKATCELPPELCSIIMSPISISTFYSFSFLPSVMHRIESLLLAEKLKRIIHKDQDQCMQNVDIPTIKVLEAITTKKCQEKFHLESLEILGDSFLKYAAGQQVFKIYQNEHEGILTSKKEKIISNASLCKLGCARKIPGFIRNEPFNPKMWIVPGDISLSRGLDEEFISSTKLYVQGSTTLKNKVIADVVEALIGAFLITGGESVAISFMAWLGINIDLVSVPHIRPFPLNPENHVNISHLKSVLNYQFHDASYLVEALTHGSYMLPEIPRCYQRLEFLGDSVLDYVITEYLYRKYRGISPGLLTDLRSASVNNDCYAQAAVKVRLHKHILHFSQDLQSHLKEIIYDSEDLSSVSTFDWKSEKKYPKVLGDVIESLAGAIYVDSGYDKEMVFQSIRPLLEPMITPEMLRLHPVRELHELCQKRKFKFKERLVFRENRESLVEVEVEANGMPYKKSRRASDKNTAKRLACKDVLSLLKEGVSGL